MKLGVVIPVYNQYELAIKAISSISTKYEWQLYLQPNWRNNIGVSRAWNAGIRQAIEDNCNYILVINDDVILSPWTIDNQVAVLTDPTSPDLVLTTGWATTPPDPNDPYSMMDYPEPPNDMAWVPGADFACFMINRTGWVRTGEFDENFSPAYFEDNDYHRRILLGGMQARIVPQAPYYHFGSKTQTSEKIVSDKNFDLNKEYYKYKWGGVPGAETYSKPYNNHEASIAYIEY